MKITHNVVTSFIALAASAVALMATPIPGPKGGHILTAEAPHTEFFVAADRTAIVSFYDQALKPVALTGQVVSAIAETAAGKVKLEFAEKAGVLVSTLPLPEGEGYTIVVQIREKADARPKNYRVIFHDELCAECNRSEYACICDHAGESADVHSL